jgi:acetylornithine deacetylase/succinyl-diaminopimelate desuccinylase-like protein
VREFVELLAIPNVRSRADELARNAEFLVRAFTRRRVRMEFLQLRTGPPYLYGELLTPGTKRTLGIYVHYDGQPVNEGRWTYGPWQPTLCTGSLEEGGRERALPETGEEIDPEWRLFARSAADDKAPFAALLGALDALQGNGCPPTVNLKFLFDGEEESSSLNLPRVLELYGDSYADVDLWLLLDGPVHPSRRPQLLFGVRGVTGLELTVYGAVRPLHSGHYGNWAPEPGVLLSRLLASMMRPDGRVTIEGFYDADSPTPAERKAVGCLPDNDAELRDELALPSAGFDGLSRNECNTLSSLTVRGLKSAQVGSRARNVIPGSAEASLGLRLARGVDPESMLDRVEAHIRAQGFHITRVPPDRRARLAHPLVARVVRQRGYPAASTSTEHPLVAPLTRAVKAAAGQTPFLVPMSGASLPLHYFTETLGKPAVVVPIANHDNNQHAADENLRLANLWYGVDLYAALLGM